jgi:hypothetical protein
MGKTKYKAVINGEESSLNFKTKEEASSYAKEQIAKKSRLKEMSPETKAKYKRLREIDERIAKKQEGEYISTDLKLRNEFGGKYTTVNGVSIRIADHSANNRNTDFGGNKADLSFVFSKEKGVGQRFRGDNQHPNEHDISGMTAREAKAFIRKKIKGFKGK